MEIVLRRGKEPLGDPLALRRQLAGLKKSSSEAKNSLKALQASELRYRRLFETAKDGILILNAETGEIDDVNPYMIDMLHYSYEEFMGMKLWEVSPFKNTVLNKVVFEELQNKGYIRYKDLPLETKEGKPVAVEFVSNVYKANGDKVIQCNIRNISERKDLDRKLQESILFQQRLIDALPVPVFYKDLEGRYLGCNRSFEDFFGQKRDQIIGKLAYELTLKDFADIYREKDLALLQNPGIQIYDSAVKGSDGVVHNVIFHKATFPNADGSVGGLIGAILDISIRKKVEEALRSAEARYRLLFEQSPDGIVIIDTDSARPIEFNEAAHTQLGYSREEFAKLSIFDFDVIETPEETRATIAEVLQGGRKDFETRHRTRQGEIRDVHVTAQITEILGQPFYHCIWRDITESKRAEKKLQQTVESLRKAFGATIQVMISAVELKDPYTAGHQIRSADLARAIAAEAGLPQENIDGLRMAGSIHDIGKLSIPAEILSKPTKLTNLEFALIKEHSRIGYEMLKDVESPWPLAQIVYQHHERMNGSGYPRNLKGNEILMEARIMAVADVVESMASHRPYRPALGIDAAMEEIEKNKGILYDNTVADACLRLFREKGFKLEAT